MSDCDEKEFNMTISADFLQLLTDFVINYKTNGAPSLWTWNKENNHEKISLHLDELLKLIKEHCETFNDTSIIEYLNNTILLSAKTNPYLLQCWIHCLTQYNMKTQSYKGIGSFHIMMAPEGKPAEKIINEFQTSLSNLTQSFLLAQQAHDTQMKLLKEDLKTLQTANNELIKQNSLFKQQIKDQELFASIHQPILDAENQLNSVLTFLNTLQHITKTKQYSQDLPPPSMITVDIKQQVSPQDQLQKTPEHLPNQNIQMKENPPKVILLQQNIVPPPPKIQPPPPPKIQPPPPPKIGPPASKTQSFFSNNGSNLFDELDQKLKERNKRQLKEQQNDINTVSSIEKKK